MEGRGAKYKISCSDCNHGLLYFDWMDSKMSKVSLESFDFAATICKQQTISIWPIRYVCAIQLQSELNSTYLICCSDRLIRINTRDTLWLAAYTNIIVQSKGYKFLRKLTKIVHRPGGWTLLKIRLPQFKLCWICLLELSLAKLYKIKINTILSIYQLLNWKS